MVGRALFDLAIAKAPLAVRSVDLPRRDARRRLATVFSIVLLVISSSLFFASINPADVLAVDNADNNEGMIDTNSYRAAQLIGEKASLSNHDQSSSSVPLSSSSSSSTPSLTTPSTLSQDGSDFTAQDFTYALLLPSNNIVNTRATYDIGFRTNNNVDLNNARCIEMQFPAGTITSNSLIEFASDPPNLLDNGLLRRFVNTPPGQETLVYELNGNKFIPRGTVMRFEIGFFNNPVTPTSNADVDIFIRSLPPGGMCVPPFSLATQLDKGSSNLYTIKQTGTSDIADNAITFAKIAPNAVNIVKSTRTGPQVSVAPDSFGTSIAECDPGQVAAGGGYAQNLDKSLMRVAEEKQISLGVSDSWAVTMFNPGAFTDSFLATANCIFVTP